MAESDLFWQALAFSAIAFGIPFVVAWWLYVSPMEQWFMGGERLDKRWATRFALMIGASSLLLNAGAYWDASEHIITGIVPGGTDFLWPPHILLYSGFLLALLVALLALTAVAIPNLSAGIRDPRVWVRRNPMLGAVALSAGYAIVAIPGDAIWHQLYGVDLTAWSPPHMLLAFSLALVGICSAAMLAQTNPSDSHDLWRDVVVAGMLALLMSETFLAGVSEWELRSGGVQRNIANRPIWLYPVISAGLSFAVLALARHLTRLRWAATVTAVIFLIIRFLVIGGMLLINGVSPRLPLVFVLGAIAIDGVATRSDSRLRKSFITALGYTLGFSLGAFPQLALIGLPFRTLDYVTAFVVTFIVVAILQPTVEFLGVWFEKQRTPTIETVLQTV